MHLRTPTLISALDIRQARAPRAAHPNNLLLRENHPLCARSAGRRMERDPERPQRPHRAVRPQHTTLLYHPPLPLPHTPLAYSLTRFPCPACLAARGLMLPSRWCDSLGKPAISCRAMACTTRRTFTTSMHSASRSSGALLPYLFYLLSYSLPPLTSPYLPHHVAYLP